MLHIRSVTTASGATAIQVVEYVKRKVKVRLHVGSAHSPEEKKTLIESAQKWMAGETRQPVLFPRDMRHSPFDAYDYVGTMHPFARECLHRLLGRFGFAGGRGLCEVGRGKVP